MRYRTLGSSGITVSVIGFGAWGIGGDSYGTTDDKESKRALEEASARGISFFDTSDLYGDGHSEWLIGEVFEHRRDEVVIATKGGMLPHSSFVMPQDFSRDFLRRQLEQSLRRLRSDYVDVYQLHSPTLDDVTREHAMDTMLEFQREGKIRAMGISARSPKDAAEAISVFGVGVVQANFSLLDQRAIDHGLFDVASRARAGIIARTPLCFGFLTGELTGDETFAENDHRRNWPREQIKKWANSARLFRTAATELAISPTQLALAFCVGFDPVSTTIPGMLTSQQVAANCLAADVLLNAETLCMLRDIYARRDFYDPSIKANLSEP